MASLVKNGSNYGLIWTSGGQQTRETLKTSSKSEADQRKIVLEYAEKIGTHDPFAQKWYQNERLRHLIYTKQYKQIYQVESPTPVDARVAARQYVRFKTNTPGHWDSPNTQSNYSSKIEQFARWLPPGLRVDEITTAHVTGFLNRDDLSDFTVQSDVRTIKTFLRWCKKQGYLEQIPELSAPTPQKQIPDFIYPDQLKRLCLYKIDKEIERQKYSPYHIEPQWWHPMFWILLARTGMRPSELIRVRLPHVREGEILVAGKGKTQAARRRVPIIGQAARQTIQILTDPHVREKDALMAKSDLLFGRGSDASKRRASKEFTEAVKVRLPHNPSFRLRDLRNCWAFWFQTRDSRHDRSFAGYKLKRIMGHSTDQMSRRYMDALPHSPDIERLHRW